MSDVKRRLRVFAGPNGSGKSSLVRSLAKEFSRTGEFHLRHWINADEIEISLRSGIFELDPQCGSIDPRSFLIELSAAPRVGVTHPFIVAAQSAGGKIACNPHTVDSYVAASIADLLRAHFLNRGDSFSFERVMSHPSKIEFLQRAQAAGYFVYLYFVATRTVEVNLSRIQNRVQLGQHAVPEQKVIDRYARSIKLLPEALKVAHRAFLFDNSGDEPLWFAEKTPDGTIALRIPHSDIPTWYLSVMER